MAFMVDRHHVTKPAQYDVLVFLRSDGESKNMSLMPSSVCAAIVESGMSCKSVTWTSPTVAHILRNPQLDERLRWAQSWAMDQAFGVLSMGRVVVTDRLYGSIVSYLLNRGVVYIETKTNETAEAFAAAFSGIEHICIHSDDSVVSSSNILSDIVKKTAFVYDLIYSNLFEDDKLDDAVITVPLVSRPALPEVDNNLTDDSNGDTDAMGVANTSSYFQNLFAEGCHMNSQPYKALNQGLFFVPGLGSKARMSTLLKNLNLFMHKFDSISHHWDCLVYIYSPVDSDFWSAEKEINKLSSVCELVHNPLKRYGDHIKSMHPFLVAKSYEYVFMLLDDVKLHEDSFDIDHMIDIVKRNNVTFASPFIYGTVSARRAMVHKPENAVGFETHYIEIYAILMTTAAYTAFWELVDPLNNPCGWGPDMW